MEEVIPLGEEVLEVGKRTENRGTVRIHRYVVETPVEERVTLQSERAVVERRRPVTDKATGEILTEVTVEVVETAEVPVIGKRARLREEMVVRTERTQHVETVRETVRRCDQKPADQAKCMIIAATPTSGARLIGSPYSVSCWAAARIPMPRQSPDQQSSGMMATQLTTDRTARTTAGAIASGSTCRSLGSTRCLRMLRARPLP